MKPLSQDEDLYDYLECLSPEARRGLCTVLGLGPRTGSRELASKAKAASQGAQTLHVLLKGASPDEIAQMACWALRGPQALKNARAGIPAYMTDPVPEPQRSVAMQALATRGLCLRERNGMEVLPCAQPYLGAHALLVQLSAMLPGAPERAPLGFGLALAVGLFAVERPLVRADGAFHAAALKRLEKRLGGTSVAGLELRSAPQTLRLLGVVGVREHGNTRALEVEAHALDAAFGQDPAVLVRSLLWGADPHRVSLWTYARLRFAVAAAERQGAAAEADIEALLEVRIGRPSDPGTWQPWLAPDAWDTLHGLSTLAFVGLAEVVPDSMPPRFRLRSPAARGTAPWVVQPNFEVLVPWDAPPLRVARLGLCADLEVVDRVCRFRLTAASVRRGLEALGTSQDVVRLLEEGAGAPLAQNVKATVLGWGGTERPVLPLRGELLLASPAQIAALREIAPGAREVAPGVLLLPARTLGSTLARARELGLPVAALAQSLDELDGESPTERQREALQQVEAYLARATTEAPEPRHSPIPASPPRRAQGPAELREAAKIKALLDQILGRTDEGGEEEEDEEDDRYAEDDADDEDDELPMLDPPRGKAPSPSPWFQPPERPAHARPATDRAAPHHGASAEEAVTWSSPLPGLLRTQLDLAIQTGTTVRLLFRNSAGSTVDRLLAPLRLTRTPKGEHLEARDVQHHGHCTIVLERIVAIATGG